MIKINNPYMIKIKFFRFSNSEQDFLHNKMINIVKKSMNQIRLNIIINQIKIDNIMSLLLVYVIIIIGNGDQHNTLLEGIKQVICKHNNVH